MNVASSVSSIGLDEAESALRASWASLLAESLCKSELCAVQVSELYSAIDMVHKPRLDNAATILARFETDGVAPYLPVVYSVDGNPQASVGVIVELTSAGPLILDGVHRVVAARENGPKELCVWLSERPERLPPPCKLTRCNEITVNSERSVTPKFEGSIPKYFRPGHEIALLANDLILRQTEGINTHDI